MEKIKAKKILTAALILAAGVIFLIWSALFDWDKINTYQAYDVGSIVYTKGTVTKVLDNEVGKDPLAPGRMLGTQRLKVRLTEGRYKGDEIEVDNILSQLHNVYAAEGSRIIVCVDRPENVEPYYTVYNYDREPILAAMVILFALVMFLVGKKKGIRAFLGLAYTLGLVLFFTIPALYHGFSPYIVSIATILVSTVMSLVLLNGVSKRSACGMIATTLGTLSVGLLMIIFGRLLHVSGFNTTDADSLVLVNQATGMSLYRLLFAIVLISALGADMDVAVSLTASLDELIAVDPEMGPASLIKSGMNIGKDMIGTMSNTLILAFAGSGMTMLLSLISFGYSLRQFFSSDYLAIEMAQGICSTIGVIISVPITSAICAWLLIRQKRENE